MGWSDGLGGVSGYYAGTTVCAVTLRLHQFHVRNGLTEELLPDTGPLVPNTAMYADIRIVLMMTLPLIRMILLRMAVLVPMASLLPAVISVG